jgi:hypothetical protein
MKLEPKDMPLIEARAASPNFCPEVIGWGPMPGFMTRW